MVRAVPGGAGPHSHRGYFMKGGGGVSLFGESACAVVSSASSSEVLGWEKQPAWSWPSSRIPQAGSCRRAWWRGAREVVPGKGQGSA